MKRRKSDNPTFLTLPAPARAYVTAVVVAGAAGLAAAALQLRLDHPGLFVMLLALSVAASVTKIELPLGRSQSNLSLSHAVNFWALFALGPAASVCIATLGAWAQCTLRAEKRNPLHRIVFSIASLTVTVWAAGLPLALLQGSEPATFTALLRAAAGVRPAWFPGGVGTAPAPGPGRGPSGGDRARDWLRPPNVVPRPAGARRSSTASM